MNISDIYLFPFITNQPAGTTYNEALPIQHWQAHPAARGAFACAVLDPETAQLQFTSIPAAQANQANIPDAGQASVTESQNPAINQPPIDLAKYNALAAQGLQVIAAPFGLEIQPINPVPAVATTSDSLIQQIAADTAAIRAKLGA